VKELVDPIFLLIFALVFLAWRRRAAAAVLVAVVLILSIPLVATGIERTLERPPEGDGEPEIIEVVSGGVTASVERVVEAAAWWKMHRGARMVLAGIAPSPLDRTPTFDIEIMRDVAIARGVDPRAITLEAHSHTTREHPIELLKLPGVTPRTRVGLVTSAWHMRRAAAAFRRHFSVVIEHPTPFRIVNLSPVPSTDGLAYSTTGIREWIGIVWYAIRG
jgi:uncharacterized SAM-binding protein YcdF (DUF218 family)